MDSSQVVVYLQKEWFGMGWASFAFGTGRLGVFEFGTGWLGIVRVRDWLGRAGRRDGWASFAFGTGWLGVVPVRDGLGVEPGWLGSVSTHEGRGGGGMEVWAVSVLHCTQRVGSHQVGWRSCWGLLFVGVFVVRPHSHLRLLSVDVAEGNTVGANEVW